MDPIRRIAAIVLALALTAAAAGQQKPLRTYLAEAETLKTQGKVQDAVVLLKEAVAAYPNEASAHFELAKASGETARNNPDMTAVMEGINTAFAEWEKTMVLDPNHVEAHMYYGIYAVNVPVFFGRLESGVKHLETAKTLFEKQPSEQTKGALGTVYQYLGKGYELQKRPDLAKAAYEKVLVLVPGSPSAAQAKLGLENLKKAEASTASATPAKENAAVQPFTEKLRQNPNDLNALLGLAQGYVKQRDWTSAVETLRKAVQVDSNRADVWFLLAKAVMADASTGYDKRIYQDQNTRTNLAFDAVRTIEKAHRLDPGNPRIKLWYASACIQMPFFVMKMDEGLAALEQMAKDPSLPDSLRAEVLYQLGFGYRKKGNAVWMQLVKNLPNSAPVQSVYEEYGTRETVKGTIPKTGERVVIRFHLGFRDEIEPQTALWVEDPSGRSVRTLYVSGFSGFAKEKQVDLPEWGAKTKFETDGTTGASIDWGSYVFAWDLKDRQGKRVPNGKYKIKVEVSWWPSMRSELAAAEIQIGNVPAEASVEQKPFIPYLKVKYER